MLRIGKYVHNRREANRLSREINKDEKKLGNVILMNNGISVEAHGRLDKIEWEIERVKEIGENYFDPVELRRYELTLRLLKTRVVD